MHYKDHQESGISGFATLQAQTKMKAIRHKKKTDDEENAKKAIIKVTLSSLVKKAVKNCRVNTNDTTELVPQEFVEAIIIHCQYYYQEKGQEKVLDELRSVLLKLSFRMTEFIACVHLLDVLMQRIPLFAAVVNSNFRQMVSGWEKSGLFGQSNEYKQVREYIVQMTELWSITYGDNLREFAAMHRYMCEGLSIHAPSVQVSSAFFHEASYLYCCLNAQEKLRQVIEQKQAAEERDNAVYFASLDQLLRVALPETIAEAKSSLERLQESFDQLFSDFHFDNGSHHNHSIPHLRNTETENNEINWDEIEWEQDEDTVDDINSVAPAISGDMRLVIDPLQAISHPDKDELLQAISNIATDLMGLYSVMSKFRRRIDDFILQHQPSSSSNSVKRKHAPTEYDISVMLELAESNRNELKSVIRSVKRALQEQCRTLLLKRE